MKAGNIAVLLLEEILIGIVVIFGMKQYISFKTTPFYASFTTWIGWFVCFSIVFLVPVDILATDYNNCLISHVNDTSSCPLPITYVPDNIMTIQWKVMYWGTLIFSWAIFPILQTFSTTGDFRIQERLARAVKDNFILYIFMGIAGLIFVIALFAIKQMSFNGLVSLVMSLANAYGLILVVVTMGYGLVDLPRNLLRKSDRFKTLHHYRVDAVVLKTDLEKTHKELFDLLALIKTTSDRAGEYDPYRPYLDIIISKCPLEFGDVESVSSIPIRQGEEIELTYDKLVTMHANLLDLTHQYQRAQIMYERLLGKGFATEDIISTLDIPAQEREKRIQWSFKVPSKNPTKVKIEYYWLAYIYPIFYKVLGVLCAILSAMVVWSELSLAFGPKKYSVFALVILNAKDSLNGIGLQIFCFIPLLYMTICAYTTLFKIRIFNYYRLVPQQLTNSMSIMFSANYLCRLAAPLSFNFMQISALTDASFTSVMGEMDAFSLGRNFIYFFPIFVGVVCVVSLFNIHKRVASLCCIPQLRVVVDTSLASAEKGMKILKDERDARSASGGVPPPKTRVAIIKDFITGKKDKDGANKDIQSNNKPTPSYKAPPKQTRVIEGLSRDYSSKSGTTYKTSSTSNNNNNNNNNGAILTSINATNSTTTTKIESKTLLSNYWDKLNQNNKPFDDDDDDDYIELNNRK